VSADDVAAAKGARIEVRGAAAEEEEGVFAAPYSPRAYTRGRGRAAPEALRRDVCFVWSVDSG